MAKVSEDVEEQQVGLENVKNDVVLTGKNVDILDAKVKRQGKDMKHVKEDVTKAEKKLKVVEKTVKETVARVDKLEAMVRRTKYKD